MQALFKLVPPFLVRCLGSLITTLTLCNQLKLDLLICCIQ